MQLHNTKCVWMCPKTPPPNITKDMNKTCADPRLSSLLSSSSSLDICVLLRALMCVCGVCVWYVVSVCAVNVCVCVHVFRAPWASVWPPNALLIRLLRLCCIIFYPRPGPKLNAFQWLSEKYMYAKDRHINTGEEKKYIAHVANNSQHTTIAPLPTK